MDEKLRELYKEIINSNEPAEHHSFFNAMQRAGEISLRNNTNDQFNECYERFLRRIRNFL